MSLSVPIEVGHFVCCNCNNVFRTDRGMRSHFIKAHAAVEEANRVSIMLEESNHNFYETQWNLAYNTTVDHLSGKFPIKRYDVNSPAEAFHAHQLMPENGKDSPKQHFIPKPILPAPTFCENVIVERFNASIAMPDCYESKSKSLRNTLPQICKCRYCPKTFFYKRYMRKHERLQHEMPAELQGESSALVFHLKNTEIYKIRCPLCVKRFSSQRLLKQHLAFHNRAEKMDDFMN